MHGPLSSSALADLGTVEGRGSREGKQRALPLASKPPPPHPHPFDRLKLSSVNTLDERRSPSSFVIMFGLVLSFLFVCYVGTTILHFPHNSPAFRQDVAFTHESISAEETRFSGSSGVDSGYAWCNTAVSIALFAG